METHSAMRLTYSQLRVLCAVAVICLSSVHQTLHAQQPSDTGSQ